MCDKKYDLPASEGIIKQIDAEIAKEMGDLKKIPLDEKKKKNEDIKYMISYYIKLTNEIEQRRNRIYNFTLQMLAIYISALGLLLTQYLKFTSSNAAIWAKIIFYVILFAIVIQIMLIILYAIPAYLSQSSWPYVFSNSSLKKFNLTKYGNRWKWFYYGDQEIQKINLSSKTFEETLSQYLKSLKNFIKNYREEDLNSEIENNIIQLHLLRVHNYYKNKFYLRLSKAQKISSYIWELACIFVCFILLVRYFSFIFPLIKSNIYSFFRL